MTRTLLVTPAEVAAGWIVRPGDLCHSVRCAWSGPPPWPDDCRCKGQMQPPADLVAAAAPCETCKGRRKVTVSETYHGDGWIDRPCYDCRIELLGECLECFEGCDVTACQDCGEDYSDPCDRHLAAGHVPSADPYGDGQECESCCCRCSGQWRSVILGYAYPVGGVLPIIGANDDRPPGHHIAPAWLAEGDIWFLCDEHLYDAKVIDSFPGSPNLVGQYALQIAVTA